MPQRVFLTGFMGCGKSTFGKRLAKQLEWDFIDTDKEIVRRAGMSVSDIFAQKGEKWFRELEEKVLRKTVKTGKDTVVALGGGAVCRQGAIEVLSSAGITVYLKMSAPRLIGRMGEKGRAKRPKIAGMNDEELLAYIEKTLPEREIYYNKANFALDCTDIPDEKIVGLLLQQIEDRTKQSRTPNVR